MHIIIGALSLAFLAACEDLRQTFAALEAGVPREEANPIFRPLIHGGHKIATYALLLAIFAGLGAVLCALVQSLPLPVRGVGVGIVVAVMAGGAVWSLRLAAEWRGYRAKATSAFLACTLLLAGIPALAAPAASIIAFTDPPSRPSPPRTPQKPVRKPIRKGGKRK